VEKHADELSGMGESGENAPIEANFDETTSILTITRADSSHARFWRSFAT
jgi:hypothetical protein